MYIKLSIASHELHMKCTSHEVIMNVVWIEYELSHDAFVYISYVSHMYFVRMKLIWISNQFYMNFIWTCRELHQEFVEEDTCVLHANFTWTSYNSYDSFICTSYAGHMEYDWNLYEIDDNDFRIMQTSIVFHMSYMWSKYETFIWFVWSSCEIHMLFASNSQLSSCTHLSWSSRQVHMKFI